MIRECIILAGGLGTRLRSVVADKPKCMAPVGGQPFLYYLLNYLHQQGITHAVLSLGYLGEQITEWCNSAGLPLELSFVTEAAPLGTGGAVMNALPALKGDSCFITNGDTFFEVPLADYANFHQQQGSAFSLALKPMREFERYGSVQLDEQGRIIAFLEKQYCAEGLINGGIYLTSASYLKSLQLPVKFSLEKEVLEKQPLYGFISDTYFIDIGIPADYEQAQHDLVK